MAVLGVIQYLGQLSGQPELLPCGIELTDALKCGMVWLAMRFLVIS